EIVDDEIVTPTARFRSRSSSRAWTQCCSNSRSRNSWSCRTGASRTGRCHSRCAWRHTGGRLLNRGARLHRCAGLCGNTRRLLRWCSCGWRRIRWRLLGRPLRLLSKRAQCDETETESKQCFHIFGGVELTARHISFIPKPLDTSRDKSFHFSSVTLRLGERHLYFASGDVLGCRIRSTISSR